MNEPVDLSYTKKELKDRNGPVEATATPGKSSEPKYPWGLEIRLDETSLKKLGMDGDLPEVGELCQVTGIGRIVSVSQRESEGSSSKEVAIQIERMNLEVKEESDAAEAAEGDAAFVAGAKRGSGRGGY